MAVIGSDADASVTLGAIVGAPGGLLAAGLGERVVNAVGAAVCGALVAPGSVVAWLGGSVGAGSVGDPGNPARVGGDTTISGLCVGWSVVGRSVGVGADVGVNVGVDEGTAVGVGVGAWVGGDVVGCWVCGCAVGSTVGFRVGAAVVGAPVGARVGDAVVGACDGCGVGTVVGCNVGV